MSMLTLRHSYRPRTVVITAAIALLALMSTYIVLASISVSSIPYTQNFDGMGIPATATTPSNLPTDFRADALPTPSVRTVGNFATAGSTTARAGGAGLSNTAANGIYNSGSGTTTLGRLETRCD